MVKSTTDTDDPYCGPLHTGLTCTGRAIRLAPSPPLPRSQCLHDFLRFIKNCGDGMRSTPSHSRKGIHAPLKIRDPSARADTGSDRSPNHSFLPTPTNHHSAHAHQEHGHRGWLGDHKTARAELSSGNRNGTDDAVPLLAKIVPRASNPEIRRD